MGATTMATDEEIYKMIVKTEGEEKAKALAAAVAVAEKDFKQLLSTLGASDAATRAAAGNLSDLQKQLDKAGTSAKGAGQMLTQLGYVADDVQYGFKGIANNIQPLLSAIPALAGLAAPISIAAIAAYQLYEHWDQLAGLFGKGKTKTEADEMDELGKATKRTADEEERYQKLKERKTHRDAQDKPADEVSERKKAIDDAVRNGPKEGVDQGLDLHFKKQIQLMAEASPEHADAEEAVKNRGRGSSEFEKASFNKKADKGQEKLNELYAKARERFRNDLGNDDQKANVKKLTDLALKNPNDFGPGGRKFGEALKEASKTPEEKANEKDADAAKAEADKVNSDDADKEDKKRVEERDEDERQEKEEKKRKEDSDSKLVQFQEQGRHKMEEEAAGQLGGGHLGKLAATGKMTDADVLGGLRGLGYSDDTAGEIYQGVQDHLDRKGTNEARARAGKDGVGMDEARRRIQGDQDREDRDRAKGLAEAGGDAIGAHLKAGGNLQGGQAALFEQLRDKFGDAQAKLLVGAATDRGVGQQADEAFQKQHNRPSQVINSAGLADSIQSGIGGDQDNGKQTVEQLKKANENLERMINQAGNGGPILRR
jgi:hypothetical protein